MRIYTKFRNLAFSFFDKFKEVLSLFSVLYIGICLITRQTNETCHEVSQLLKLLKKTVI